MAEDQHPESTQHHIRQAFAALAAKEDHKIDPLEAAILIAREEYSDLDPAEIYARLDELAAQVQDLLDATPKDATAATIDAEDADTRSERREDQIISAINHILFEKEHFRGNRANYYNTRNSFINDVLRRRTGIPITLSLVYIEIARRIGLEAAGIGLPGHFVVRCKVSSTNTIYLDPYQRGKRLHRKDCENLARSVLQGSAHFDQRWLLPINPRQFIVRMLNNLKHIYIHQEDFPRALAACDRILLLVPMAPLELRDRGIIHMHLKHYASAIRDLSAYTKNMPEAEDVEKIRQQIKALRQLIILLN